VRTFDVEISIDWSLCTVYIHPQFILEASIPNNQSAGYIGPSKRIILTRLLVILECK